MDSATTVSRSSFSHPSRPTRSRGPAAGVFSIPPAHVVVSMTLCGNLSWSRYSAIGAWLDSAARRRSKGGTA
ncbi:hypothetical protein NM962_07100 [Mycobacterium sp. SVM_VP21]|nr:hypothetical protein NM962_07100 [Mycobacterium sp. SVM_VP21]